MANSFTYVHNGSGLSAPNSNTAVTGTDPVHVGFVFGPEDTSVAIDGKLLNRIGMRILLKDDMVISGSDSSQANGIYEVSQVGGNQGASKLEILIQTDGDGDYDAAASEKIMFEFDGDVFEIGFSTTSADSTSWAAGTPRTWNIRTNESAYSQ